jgi:hypothetical protein
MGSVRFTAELMPRGLAAAVLLDDEHVAAVGEGAKRFPVVATVSGYTWRTTVMRMRGEFLLGLNRAVRNAAGVEAGDTIEVALDLDTTPREVEVPEPLANALAEDSEARAISNSWLTPTARSTPAGSTTQGAARRASDASHERWRCCGRAKLGAELPAQSRPRHSSKIAVIASLRV